jgi:uncharacterized lipoprotein YbaY
VALIEGEVLLPTDVPSFSDATLIVELQDTREADVPARILARHIQTGISYDPARGKPLHFSVAISESARGPGVTVSVLLDLDGDGHITRGDYINMESCPVTSDSAKLRVRVQRVT